MRIHRLAMLAACPALAAVVVEAGCGSSADTSCSGPNARVYAYCTGDASEEGPAQPDDGGADVRTDTGTSDAPVHTDAGGEAEAGGCQAPTSLECSGTCVDPSLPSHCGTCSNVCEGPDSGTGAPTCTNGTCGLGCSGATSLNCSGACVDPSQPAHCGSCTNACPGPVAGTGSAVCTLGTDGGGECTVQCSGTTTQVCGTSCYAPTDVNHCGSCSNACPAPPSGNGQATCTGTTPACGVSCTTGVAHVCASDCKLNTDEPSDTADPCIINEQFGIFVSPAGSDSAAGTQLSPVATIGHAMDLAKAAGKRVYACGSAGNYAENLVVGSTRDGVKAYGGLDCTTAPSQWTYNAAKLATIAPAGGYALQVQGTTTGVAFTDIGFVAANAAGVGASSIAVFASSASGVVLKRCKAQAGTATQGQDQSQPTPFGGSAPSGIPGAPSKSSGGTGAGGPAQSNPSCNTSVGGAGGSDVAGQVDGQPGEPGSSLNDNAGTSAKCNLVPAQGGGGGTPGTPGPLGAVATTWATFLGSGWSPAGGGPGGPGSVGQGGGGGGSAGPINAVGGGGGGGAGGCGGSGGAGGSGGGSSIAVLTYGSSIDLEACTLVSANAGRGGNGAPGQAGQSGGGGGTPGTASCSGGAGGSGGNGGAGGGGTGGLSAGVVWTGTAPTVNGGTQTPATAGAAGQNGDGTTTAKAGTAGGVVQFQ